MISVRQGYNENMLIQELIKGSEAAFREIFDYYRNDLYKYSLSMVSAKAFAEEIIQEVFLKVWLNREAIDTGLSFKSYLFTITRNDTIKFLKKAANSQKLREEVFYKSQKLANLTDIHMRESELEELKEKALSKLSPKRRQIFEMSRNEDKSYEEIAKELGISISTVRNQMSKSLGILRDYLLNNKDLSLVFVLFYLDWI